MTEKHAKSFIFSLFLFLFLMVLSLFLVSLIWTMFIDGRLFYNSDPIFDMIPPFIGDPQFHDHFIAPKAVVFLVWFLFLAGGIVGPLWLSVKVYRERTKAI